MDKIQELFDKFVDYLLGRLDEDVIDPKELSVIQGFLKSQDIGASEKHKGLNALSENFEALPFDSDEMPIRRVK